MSTSLPAPASIRSVAVRLTNWVGDVVMGTPFLGRLRELFPGARIVAFGRKSVIPLLHSHPDVDEAFAIDDRTVRGYGAAVARVRGLRADLGFALPNSINSAAILWAGGVRARVGYARDARRWLLTHPVALRPADLAVHEVRYYLRLLHAWESEHREPGPLRLVVSESERESMRGRLAGWGMDPSRPIIGVNPAALFGTAKRWPAERYAVAARAVSQKLGGAPVMVTGLEAERTVAHEVCSRGGAGFHNAAGEMTLRELMAFLSLCRIYLTNDSGAMHIAAALGTPLVAVFGSTDWVTTAPLSPSARIVRVETECAPCLLKHCPIDHRCMTRVTPEMVVEAAEGFF